MSRYGRVDLADAHAAVLEVEDEVVAAIELAGFTCLIAWKTPTSTRLTPLVSTRLARAY